MSEPDWTLLTQKIHQTWEDGRYTRETIDNVIKRLDRIEQQLLVVVKMNQAREGEQAVNRQLVETWAAIRSELLEHERRMRALEEKIEHLSPS